VIAVAWAQVRRRPARAVALGAGVLVAAVCFGLLSAEAHSSGARVTATVRHNFRAAYDILVRPRGAETKFEHAHHVVDDGFLSALFGGITMRQYHEIRALPGVSLAAPVANVGYFVDQQTLFVPLPRSISRARPQLFRIALDWDVHGGLSRYPGASLYVYWTPKQLRFARSHDKYQPAPVGSQRQPDGRSLAVCAGFSKSTPPLPSQSGGSAAASGVAGISINPYTAAEQPSFDCAARIVTINGNRLTANVPNAVDAEPSGRLGAEVTFDLPVLIAGVDPPAEDALVGLRAAMRSGRYLGQDEGLSTPGNVPGTDQGSSQCEDYSRTRRRCAVRTYPVIASTRTYLDEAAHLTVEQLQVPPGTDLPARLANTRSAYTFVTHLTRRPEARLTVSPTRAWRSGLAHFTASQAFSSANGSGFSLSYWRPSTTTDRVSRRSITPAPVANDPNVWSDVGQVEGYSLAPPGSADTWFRHLTAYPSSGAPKTIDGKWTGIAPLPRLIGTFDPTRLRGFSALSRVPLQSFYPPTVTGANPQSKGALHGGALGPTSNIAGYLSQPPLLLTTLQGALALENGEGDTIRFRGQVVSAYQGASPHAPISTVQVRVGGVSGPNRRSLQRIDDVACQIAARTGLTVDITAGSSPTNETISLAAGRYGQPRLLVNQGWVKKGVAITITGALAARDLGLIALTLIICALSVAAAALAAVRGRRSELATLRALGWSEGDLLGLLFSEIALVGTLASVMGCLLTLILSRVTGIELPAIRLLLTIPVGVIVAMAAGVTPARVASRLSPLDALRDPVTVVRRHAWAPRSIGALALSNVRQVRSRSLLGLGAMGLGITGLSFLIAIDLAFSDGVRGDLLGGAISNSVAAVDVVSAALVAVLGAGTLAGVVFADQRERAGELATLRALGWTRAAVMALTGSESALLGLAGAVSGAILGGLCATGATGDPGTSATAAAIGLGVGAALTALASALVAAGQRGDVQLSR
jgi:putative ABC transport system permease protein